MSHNTRTLEELQKRYAHVLNNKAVQDISYWKQPNSDTPTDENGYVDNTINSLKGLKEKSERVLNNISKA